MYSGLNQLVIPTLINCILLFLLLHLYLICGPHGSSSIATFHWQDLWRNTEYFCKKKKNNKPCYMWHKDVFGWYNNIIYNLKNTYFLPLSHFRYTAPKSLWISYYESSKGVLVVNGANHLIRVETFSPTHPTSWEVRRLEIKFNHQWPKI